MSEHDKNTVNEDPDQLADEELDEVAGGVGNPSQNMRPDQSALSSRGIIIENRPAIIDDNHFPSP